MKTDLTGGKAIPGSERHFPGTRVAPAPDRRGGKLATLFLSLFLASHGPALAPAASTSWEVELAAGPHDRRGTPVRVPLPAGAPAEAAWSLRVAGGAEVPVQFIKGGGGGGQPGLSWRVGAPLPAGETRRYHLSASPRGGGRTQTPAPVAVQARDDGEGIVLGPAGRPLLRYHYAVAVPPAGVPLHFSRSGFIHPVYGPSGAVLTDDFPPDHYHQHGVFFAWTSSSVGGRKVDFWNQAKREGEVRHQALEARWEGPVESGFRARLEHVDLKAPGGPGIALEETWTVRAFRDVGAAGARLFELESVQRRAVPGPLKIAKNHYGAMALRGRRDWLKAPGGGPNADFLTGEGKGRKNGNHTRPRWVALSGPVGGGEGGAAGATEGIVVMDHPDNFRHPQPVRLHPDKPYFAYSPMVLGDFELRPGEPYVSRYRYASFAGRPDPTLIERLWNDFAQPPVVRLIVADK